MSAVASTLTPVCVVARTDENGKVTPIEISLRGKTYPVDRVLGVEAIPNPMGLARFDILIGRHRTGVFLNRDGLWSVDERHRCVAC